MAKLMTLTLATAVLLSAGTVGSKSGSPIPVPKVKITEAIELATEYFLNKETRAIDAKQFKKSEYILTLAQYTRSFGGKRQEAWAWRIRFVHPVANDHSMEYQVTGDRKVVFLRASE